MSRIACALVASFLFVLAIAPRPSDASMIAPRHWHPGPDQPVIVNEAVNPIDLKAQNVTVTIEGLVAKTIIEQTFVNPNAFAVEATYIFPVPVDAALDKFTLTLDGKTIEGKVFEAEEAKKEFARMVRESKNPALLSYVGRKMFEARIAPIQPAAEAKVRLQYIQELKAEGGLFSYRYPLDAGKLLHRPIESLSLSLSIDSPIPIKSIYSPSHEIAAKRDGDKKASFEMKETNALPSRDFECYFSLSEKDFGLNLLSYREKGAGGYFLAMLAPKQDASTDEVAKKDVVFVIDSSGSMKANGKMEQAKGALKFCLQALKPDDRFNIIDFDKSVLPFRQKLIQASAEERKSAIRFVDENIQAQGGTAIHEALLTALRMHKPEAGRPLMIVFMTDGLPTIGERNIDRILGDVRGAVASGVRVFAFGVGYDVNTRLLDTLADENRGKRMYVTPEENLEVKVSDFYEKVSQPVLTDVVVDLGKGIEEVFPKGPYDIYRGSQLVLIGRYKEPGKRNVALKGVQNGKPVEFSYAVDLPEASAKADFLPKLWASRKVAYLLDEIRMKGETTERKNQVVALAKEFSIATPYTSFLVEGPEARYAAADRAAPQGAWNGGGKGGAGGGATGGAMPPMGRPAMRKASKGKSAPAVASRADARERGGFDAPGASPTGPVADAASPPMKSPAAPPPSTAPAPAMEKPMAEAAGMRAESGRDAVLASRSIEAKKESMVVADSSDAKSKFEGAERRVGKRTFTMKDGFWTDASFDAEKDKSNVVEIEYLGDKYLDLAADPEIAQCLALGEKLILKVGDKVFKIAPKAPAAK
ncbi:MAG: VIT and VWA domain-containing protein [Planctomycetota bacterium]